MPVKIKTVRNKLPKMQRQAQDIDGLKINVGYIKGGEQAWLASIHEYGCVINVTDKMRGFLGSQGLHLKKSTRQIVIPERSFLRAGFDKHHKRVVDTTNPLLADVLGGTMNIEQFGDTVGQLLESRIKDFAVDLSSPANNPFTVAKKGSSNPLVDSGDMIGAIDHEVER